MAPPPARRARRHSQPPARGWSRLGQSNPYPDPSPSPSPSPTLSPNAHLPEVEAGAFGHRRRVGEALGVVQQHAREARRRRALLLRGRAGARVVARRRRGGDVATRRAPAEAGKAALGAQLLLGSWACTRTHGHENVNGTPAASRMCTLLHTHVLIHAHARMYLYMLYMYTRTRTRTLRCARQLGPRARARARRPAGTAKGK